MTWREIEHDPDAYLDEVPDDPVMARIDASLYELLGALDYEEPVPGYVIIEQYREIHPTDTATAPIDPERAYETMDDVLAEFLPADGY